MLNASAEPSWNFDNAEDSRKCVPKFDKLDEIRDSYVFGYDGCFWDGGCTETLSKVDWNPLLLKEGDRVGLLVENGYCYILLLLPKGDIVFLERLAELFGPR